MTKLGLERPRVVFSVGSALTVTFPTMTLMSCWRLAPVEASLS